MFNIYYVQTMLFIHYCVNTFVLKILCDFAVFAVNRYSSKVNLGVKVIKLLFFLLLIIVAVNGYSSKVNLGVFWLQCNHIDHSCIYTHTRAHTHKHPHTHTQTHTDMQHTDYTLTVYDRVLKTIQSEMCLFTREC